MRYAKRPEEPAQNQLFDTSAFGWWHTQLDPSAYQRLADGVEGVFRTSILKLMPVEQVGAAFHPSIGRQTKELYAICGLLLLGEFRNWSVDQTANAWCFDASVQFALNLPRDHQSLCPRTVDNYRQLVREDEIAQEIYEEVTAAIVKEMKLQIGKQRLDSTHIFSDMARFGRLKLLSVTVKRFLTQLKRHDEAGYLGLPEELRERYQASESRLFGQGTSKAQDYEKSIAQVGLDMAALVERFGEDASHKKRTSFGALERAFFEHFEVTRECVATVLEKASDENEQSSRVMQNPSDEDAGYDGHKGPGYQVQISQVYDSGEEGPGLIVGCVPQSAAQSDSSSLSTVLDQQERMGTKPEKLLADTGYGSQDNVEHSQQRGVDLIAPVPGGSGKKDQAVEEVVEEEKEEADAAKEKAEGSSIPEKESTSGEVPAPLKDKAGGVKSTAERRIEQESEEWKKEYAKRSGVEGVHTALDRKTGIKKLKVRGIKAVGMAVYLKVAGWNISAAAQILKLRRKKARKEALESKNPAFGVSCLVQWEAGEARMALKSKIQRLFSRLVGHPAIQFQSSFCQ